MIPKLIHYCWLSGDPYPEKIKHCIDSWGKILPDYELVLWDTKRFPLEKCAWVKEAYDAKKYAFAADYIRLYAIYNYGGIYLDSDVEVFKRFDNLLSLPYFVGKEGFDNRIEAAAFGAEKGTDWVKMCLDYYEGRHFLMPDGAYDTKVMPDIVNTIICSHYSIKEINSIKDFSLEKDVFNLFPNDWFCANVHMTPTSTEPTYIISDKTYCVHHFANSWLKLNKYKIWLKRFLKKLGVVK